MNEVLVSEDYILVIDLDRYAGPIADPLCAYCTGFAGEEASYHSSEMCELYYSDLGIEDDDGPYGDLADDKNPLRDLVVDQQDETGHWQPCAVWPSRVYGMNAEGKAAKLNDQNYEDYNFPAGYSVGIFLYSKPTDEQFATIKQRATAFFNDIWPKLKDGEKVNIEGYRLIRHRKTAEEVRL
jgi:hypothetical protein